MARRKQPQPKAFTLPTAVAEADPPLPKELSRQGPLTLKEKKKHEKRRDELMALHGTAARLSNEDQALIHARISSGLYYVELERLMGLRTVPYRKGGMKKRDLARVLKATAHNLSDALRQQGELAEAYRFLALIDPKSKELDAIVELGRAHLRQDDDDCGCPPSNKSVSRVYSKERQEFVDLIKCGCGHMNATSHLPEPVAVLQRARGQAGEGALDAAVLKYAERLSGA